MAIRLHPDVLKRNTVQTVVLTGPKSLQALDEPTQDQLKRLRKNAQLEADISDEDIILLRCQYVWMPDQKTPDDAHLHTFISGYLVYRIIPEAKERGIERHAEIRELVVILDGDPDDQQRQLIERSARLIIDCRQRLISDAIYLYSCRMNGMHKTRLQKLFKETNLTEIGPVDSTEDT